MINLLFYLIKKLYPIKDIGVSTKIPEYEN